MRRWRHSSSLMVSGIGAALTISRNRDDVVVSKQDAVRRQMEAAIGLYFQHRDPLPVYALTGGAYSILKDISGSRHKRNCAERDRLLAADKAEELLRIEANRPNEQQVSLTILNMTMIQSELGYEKPGTFWKMFHSTYNFLKHANAGEDEVLADDIPWEHTETLLLACASAYEEMALPSSETITLFRDHCFAQRGLFDQCRRFRFRPTYPQDSLAERLVACQTTLERLNEGVGVAVVG